MSYICEELRMESLSEIPVLIRVFDRLSDLECNIAIIKRYWQDRKYPLYVVSNGSKLGFRVPESVHNDAEVIELSDNPGHIHGASQLLVNGVGAVPSQYKYLIILEADTWLLSDHILRKYIDIMENDDDVALCGANWIDKYHSTAIDFAIIRLPFFRQHSELLDFSDGDSIESRLYADIIGLGKKVALIKEAYPTVLPKAMPFNIQSDGRRRRVFPRMPMVTHHIENLNGGIEEKKIIANKTAGRNVFPSSKRKIELMLYKLAYFIYEKILFITPKSRWFKGRKFNSSKCKDLFDKSVGSTL